MKVYEAVNLDDAAYCYGVVLTSMGGWLHELVYLISRCSVKFLYQI